MKQTYNIADMNNITEHIQQQNVQLIIVAGASASGKSYFATQLAKELVAQKHKVLTISADSYYVDNTRLKHMIYGTFDHPNLIKHQELARSIKKFMKEQVIRIPEYSFVESKRTGYQEHTGKVDYIIVEGLYTINQLRIPEKVCKQMKVFVDSPLEELIMRRLIRDQERTQQGVDAIIGDITKVFPMRNIYGKNQRKKADICISNPYEILETKGKKQHYQKTHMKSSEYGSLQHREYFVDFEYHDKSHENGLIVVSEVYKTPQGDIDHVRISKRKHQENNREKFTTMSMKSTQL